MKKTGTIFTQEIWNIILLKNGPVSWRAFGKRRMSSPIKQEIRITIFFNDGVVVIYI